MKQLSCILLAAICVILLPGCWDYQPTNSLSIVSGVAVDKREGAPGYKVTFEIIDLTIPVKDEGAKGQILYSEGGTVFEAVQNTTTLLKNKLYFGNVSLVLISEAVAKEGINPVLDWFYRDAEPRETLHIAIARADSAGELLGTTLEEDNVLSYTVSHTLSQDNLILSSTSDIQLYQAYDYIRREGVELVLPVIRTLYEDDKELRAVDGGAAFSGDKLLGYLDPSYMESLLLATGKVKGGLLTLPAGEPVISLEMRTVKSSLRCLEESPLSFLIQVDITATVAESREGPISEDNALSQLEQAAQAYLQEQLRQDLWAIQQEFGCDVFGFGDCLRRTRPALWATISHNWEELFPGAGIEVELSLHLQNTGFIV